MGVDSWISVCDAALKGPHKLVAAILGPVVVSFGLCELLHLLSQRFQISTLAFAHLHTYRALRSSFAQLLQAGCSCDGGAWIH